MAEKSLKQLYTETLDQMNDLTPRQRRILESALQLFSEQGYESTTTSQIAARADVAVGSVYQKFHNKRALLAAVLTPLFETIFPQAANEFIVTTLDQDYETLTDFIHALIGDRMVFISENREEIKIMFGQLLTDATFANQIKTIFGDRLIARISPTIDKFKRKHQVVNVPDSAIVQFLIGPLALAVGKILLEIPVQSVDEEIALNSELITNALTPRKSN